MEAFCTQPQPPLPLTSDLRRTPGFGLQERIEELNYDINANILAITWAPLMLFALYLMRPGNKLTPVLFVMVALAILIQQTITLIRRADKRQKYREAMAGELATAQIPERDSIAHGSSRM